MKRILVPAFAFLLLSSCNNNSKQVTIKSEDGKATATADLEKLQNIATEMSAKAEELQKLSPYTLDQLKAMLPIELAGAKRTKESVNSYAGTAAGKAEYELNDSTEVELNILDCAGQAGAGIYQTQYLMAMNLQSDTEEESIRTVDFKSGKAIEIVKKDKSRSTLTWLSGDRLLVSLEGKNVGIETLREIAGKLDVK